MLISSYDSIFTKIDEHVDFSNFIYPKMYHFYPVKNDGIFLNTGDICYQERLLTSLFAFVGSKHKNHFYYTFAEGAEIDI